MTDEQLRKTIADEINAWADSQARVLLRISLAFLIVCIVLAVVMGCCSMNNLEDSNPSGVKVQRNLPPAGDKSTP